MVLCYFYPSEWKKKTKWRPVFKRFIIQLLLIKCINQYQQTYIICCKVDFGAYTSHNFEKVVVLNVRFFFNRTLFFKKIGCFKCSFFYQSYTFFCTNNKWVFFTTRKTHTKWVFFCTNNKLGLSEYFLQPEKLTVNEYLLARGKSEYFLQLIVDISRH